MPIILLLGSTTPPPRIYQTEKRTALDMPENPAVFINRANPSIIRVECSSMLLSITAWHKVIITSELRLRQQFKCIVSLSFRSEKGSVKSDAEQTRNKNETKIITRKKLGHASVSNILNTYQRFS